MRLLKPLPSGDFHLTENLLGSAVPQYTILSHTWGSQEVTFEDITQDSARNKTGYEKIKFCGEQTARAGLQHFWVDSCCIKKSSDSELSESLNSMFRWYHGAERCYVYLSDVSTRNEKVGDGKTHDTWEQAFRESRWFTRGWTLQELLAPSSVEFFSREGTRIGDKRSLEQIIHEITDIPISALRGSSLSHFSIDQKFGWATNRETTREEDEAYSLLGIFEISMPVVYGEGRRNAFRRLRKEIDDAAKGRECLRYLRVTNPRDDKIRIEDTKGGLIPESCHWALENEAFKQWRDDPQTHLLWIRGDPGKGKTMLLCGIIDTLSKSTADTHLLSFFYCQATDSRISNATAVLRSLLWLLVDQQPSLISHIQKEYDRSDKTVFEDSNSWVVLSSIFRNILRDPSLKPSYFIIDALDECTTDLHKLLDFIIQNSCASPHVKWLVSSRNWPQIEERLNRVKSQVSLRLELNAASITVGVSIYIQHTVCQLAQEKKYDDRTRNAVLDYLVSNANNTYLWVALVCENLKNIPRGRTRARLTSFPPGLDALYERMMKQICESEDSELCKQILASIATVYKPITVIELASVVEMLEESSDDMESLQEIVGLCGSFLVIKEATVYFVHQSAKDYLLDKAFAEIFPSGKGEIHHDIFSRSLDIMSRMLRRDMYGLCSVGYPIELVELPDPDPLAALRYSCIHWVDHLGDSDFDCHPYETVDLGVEGPVDMFIKRRFLYWLEALSLCGMMPVGLTALTKLEALIKVRGNDTALIELIQDARRFMMQSKSAVEVAPLQVYVSALVFSPARSLVKRYFKEEEPKWITVKPPVRKTWGNCLMTLEGHYDAVYSVALSHDFARLASVSASGTIKVWDPISGGCLLTLECDKEPGIIAFSDTSTKLFSISDGGMVQVWDTRTGECIQALNDYDSSIHPEVFSPDSTRFASSSRGRSVKVWDVSSGECLYSLEGYNDSDSLIAFSKDSTLLASGLQNRTIKILDARNGTCKQTLEGHDKPIKSVIFSNDSTELASAAENGTIKVWDVSTGQCIQTIDTHDHEISSVVFSQDAKLLVSVDIVTIKVWEMSSGRCLHTLQRFGDGDVWTLESIRLVLGLIDRTVKVWDSTSSQDCHRIFGQPYGTQRVAVSNDLSKLAITDGRGVGKIWDINSGECYQTLKSHGGDILAVVFSHNSRQLATCCRDTTVKIWLTSSGECLQTLCGHTATVRWITFSKDSTLLASASDDGTVKIWDIKSGECLRTLEGHYRTVTSVIFSQDSSLVASTAYNPTVVIWDLSNRKRLQTLVGHVDPIVSAAFSRNSLRLASTSQDGVTKIWDTNSGECIQTLRGHGGLHMSVAYSHDLTLLASTSPQSPLTIWDITRGKRLHTTQHGDRTFLMALSPNSDHLAIALFRVIEIYNIATGKCLQKLKGHRSQITSVAFSNDSRRLISASSDSVIKIWDISNPSYSQANEDHSDMIWAVALSDDYTKLVSASMDRTIKLWNVSSGDCLRTFEGHHGLVSSVAFFRDSTRIVSTSADNTIKVWDSSSGECLRTLRGHSSTVWSAALSSNYTQLASGSADHTVKIWDVDRGENVRTFEGHRHKINSVAFLHGSTWLASGSSDNTVRIWDTRTGECVYILEGHSNAVTAVAFSLDPTSRLASASIDETVRIWDTRNGNCVQILTTREAPRILSFDISGSYLHTDMGTMAISTPSVSDKTSGAKEPQNPRYSGVGFSADGQWITYNSNKLLWLPSEYRRRVSSISGTIIGVGVSYGKVWMCNLQVTGFGHC